MCEEGTRCRSIKIATYSLLDSEKWGRNVRWRLFHSFCFLDDGATFLSVGMFLVEQFEDVFLALLSKGVPGAFLFFCGVENR